MDEAGASPMGTSMAWGALIGVAKIEAGQSVLIHGAAGGIGAFATQIAHSGCECVVWACALSASGIRSSSAARSAVHDRRERIESAYTRGSSESQATRRAPALVDPRGGRGY